jgi:hypothetical protein
MFDAGRMPHAASTLRSFPMARSRISAQTIRNLAPVLIPLVTRVAVPMAVRSLRRKANGAEGVLEGARDRFDRSLEKTKSDLGGVRDEALGRGRKLYDDAVKQGTELIDIIASKGLEAAEEWASALGRPRRRFPWGKVLVVGAVVGVGVLLLNRD